MPPKPNRAPIAILTGPDTAVVGVPVTFDGSQSTDPDPSGIKRWELRSSDGTVSRAGTGHPGHIEVTFLRDGLVDVVLTVRDKKSAGSSPPHPVTVTPATPPEPVDCVVSEWQLASAEPWGACQPDNTQTRTETWTRTVLTEPANGGAPCGPLTETRTGTQACNYAPLPPSDYPYHDMLVARSDCFAGFPLRSQAELDTYNTGSLEAPPESMGYDPIADAARFTIDPQAWQVNEPRQKFLPLKIPAGISFFLVHDQWLTEGWQYIQDADTDAHTGYLGFLKTFRFDPAGHAGEPVWIRPYHALREAANQHGKFADFHIAAANYYTIPGESWLDSERLMPTVNQFFQEPNRLTRMFLHYEHGAEKGYVSVWMADSVQGVVQVLNKVAYKFPVNGIGMYRMNYDTSFDASNFGPALNPRSHGYDRNIAALRDITYEDALTLLVPPTSTGG